VEVRHAENDLDYLPKCYYSNYMKVIELKVSRIGNSRGVRLPAETLRRYGIGSEVLMEENSEGILLRPIPSQGDKLSWEETAQSMATEAENWQDWEVTLADGLDDLPWKP